MVFTTAFHAIEAGLLGIRRLALISCFSPIWAMANAQGGACGVV